MQKISFRNWFRIVWFSLIIVFSIWQWSTYQAQNIDPNLWISNDHIDVQEDDSKISFTNLHSSDAEIIFYPGGLVDPEAYIPLAWRIAQSEYNVHIIKMPWRLATKGYNNIKHLFNLDNKNKKYILGGHSQGGKMAAQFVYENPELINGLFLLGTSHPRDIDLSGMSIPTIKIYAEHDGLASVEEVLENKAKLPIGAQLRFIKGGNHSQFGNIGQLLMDGKSTISQKEQQEGTAELISLYFKKLNFRNPNPEK